MGGFIIYSACALEHKDKWELLGPNRECKALTQAGALGQAM